MRMQVADHSIHLRPRMPSKTASPKGGRLVGSLAAIDDGLVLVPVAIAVVIFLDDHGVPIPIPVLVAIPDIPAVTIPVAVPIMLGADGYAIRPDTDANFFRARGHRYTNAGNSGNHQSEFHCVLPYCEMMFLDKM
jgi:hypothetical protein